MSKVSVIIPTYNRPGRLKSAVQSVLDQCLEDVEIIIVDDTSDTKFLDAINAVSELNDNIFVKRNASNSGVSTCRNIGMDAATGEYILFLDDDDVLLPNMLRQSLEALEAMEEGGPDVVSCRCEVSGDHLARSKMIAYNRQLEDTFDLYSMEDRPMEHIFLYHPQVHSFMIRREAIEWVRFSSEIGYGEDLLFWFALAEKGLKFRKLDFVGCRYQLHETNITYKTTYTAKKRFYFSVLRAPAISREMASLCRIKMAVLALKYRDLRFIIWLTRSMISPRIFFRHVRHYVNLFGLKTLWPFKF